MGCSSCNIRWGAQAGRYHWGSGRGWQFWRGRGGGARRSSSVVSGRSTTEVMALGGGWWLSGAGRRAPDHSGNGAKHVGWLAGRRGIQTPATAPPLHAPQHSRSPLYSTAREPTSALSPCPSFLRSSPYQPCRSTASASAPCRVTVLPTRGLCNSGGANGAAARHTAAPPQQDNGTSGRGATAGGGGDGGGHDGKLLGGASLGGLPFPFSFLSAGKAKEPLPAGKCGGCSCCVCKNWLICGARMARHAARHVA